MFDRLLHSRRRHKLRCQLATIPIRSVLFICDGNAYRSPYAASVLKRALASSPSAPPTSVQSAGFFAPGRPAPAAAISAARERGVDLSGHVSRLVTPVLLAEADAIVVMSEEQERSLGRDAHPRGTLFLLGDLDPHSAGVRTIEDPVGRDPATIARVFSRIDRCVNELAMLITDTAVRAEEGRQH